MTNILQILKNKITRIAFVGLSGVVAFGLLPDIAAANNDTKEDISRSQQEPFGEYLAGLHAAFNNDLHAAADYHEKALALDPENLMILKKSFAFFIADGRYDLALRAAHKHTDLHITDSMVQMFLFLEQVELKNYDAALLGLDNLGDAGVYGLFKPLFRAWILVKEGKNAEAEKIVTKLLEDKNFKDFKQFHGGLFYDYLGKTELAEKIYSEALIVSGAMSLRTIEAYGILLRRLGRVDDARQLYLNYLEAAPDNSGLQNALAELDKGIAAKTFINSEEDALAEIFYTAAMFLMQDNIHMSAVIYLRYAKYLKKDFYISDYLLGQIFETNKYYEGAVENYSLIPNSHYLYFDAQLQLVWILEKTDKVDEALDKLTKLSDQFPHKKEILGTLGDIYRIHGRFGEAASAYTKYIESIGEPQEKHWSIFYTRGIVYEQDNKWASAEADLKKSLELNPDQPQVMNYLAYSWVDKGINIEKARKMLERAVALRPYDGYIIDSLGWALYRIGDMPQAVEYLEKAVLLQTDDWAINDHLGDAYWAVGRKNEARFQWRHALSLKPDVDLIAEIKTKIKDGKN
ncbi:MAG: tetratricopeptide repeat protein [Emcibacter sp.]|nr:tetratricopeptide repeat protein [Emcibacter sp.]